jgi:hypothetical protein
MLCVCSYGTQWNRWLLKTTNPSCLHQHEESDKVTKSIVGLSIIVEIGTMKELGVFYNSFSSIWQQQVGSDHRKKVPVVHKKLKVRDSIFLHLSPSLQYSPNILTLGRTSSHLRQSLSSQMRSLRFSANSSTNTSGKRK